MTTNGHRNQPWIEATVARVKRESAIAAARRDSGDKARVFLRTRGSTEMFHLPGFLPPPQELQVLLNTRNPDAYVLVLSARMVLISGAPGHLEASRRAIKPEDVEGAEAQAMLLIVGSEKLGPVEGWYLKIDPPETLKGLRRLGEWQKVEGPRGGPFIERW